MSGNRFSDRPSLEGLRRRREAAAGVRMLVARCINIAVAIAFCTALLQTVSAATLGGADLPKTGETLILTNDSTLNILPEESALFCGTIELRGSNLQFSLTNRGTLVASNGIVRVLGGLDGHTTIRSVGTVTGSSLQVAAYGTRTEVDLSGSVSLEDMLVIAQHDAGTNVLVTVSTHAGDFQVSRVMFVANGRSGNIHCEVRVDVGQTFRVDEWQNDANYGGCISQTFQGDGAVLLRQAGYRASGWSHGVQSRTQTECALTVTAHFLTCYGARVPPFVLIGDGQVYATNTVSFCTVANGALRVVPQPVLVASAVSSGFMSLEISACHPEITYWIEGSSKLPAADWAGLFSFSGVAGTNVQVDVSGGGESAFYRCRFE